MKIGLIVVLLLAAWWMAAAPPAEIVIADSVVFGDDTAYAIAAVDRSAEFAATLEHFPSAVSGQDDIVFLAGGATALVSAMDGQIWKIDLATHDAEAFVDPPLMPSGMHESPGDHSLVYFCASHLHGQTYAPDEAVGLYRLNVTTRAIEAVVLRVPATEIDHVRPVVYADADTSAPELHRDDEAGRPFAFCNDLEISKDGRRIYFSEPFAYTGAAMGGGTVREAVSLGGNGRLWRHDLDSGTTRLIAEGFHFVDGVLYDLHPGLPREQSVIVSQTPHFRLTRFWLAGAKAGTAEIVLDGITGMPDGLDRDASGNIWTGLLKERSGLLTWLHANAWIKPLFLRLPLGHVPQSRRTGVLALSPDGATPLYAASYGGPQVSDIASAIPGPGGIYLNYFDRSHTGLLRLPYPKSLKGEMK
ncbi:MAG: SMP-30/gluconolactonase/LRE family protein [Nevskiales bacterium]